MQASRDIQRLLDIMIALRDPQTGCPWDVEQDFSTIAPYTLEEAYEVVDAIERDDMDDLREELGDLLLQVVFHSRIAEEKGSFDFGHVVEAVTKKMIRRHPHVFGDEEARSAGMAKGSWNRIKQVEKDERAVRRAALGLDNGEKVGFLDDVPDTLPALVSALKYQQKAGRVGFRHQIIWDTLRVFTNEPAWMCTNRIKITQNDNAPCRIAGIEITQHIFNHQLRAAIGIGCRKRMRLINRQMDRIAVNRCRR